jgi:dTDP-4-dehydrorhamnose reductase
MRILVTGASGRLGSYLMAHPALAPHAVVGWGSRASGTAIADRLHQAVDLTDEADVAGAIRAADPEVVVHLAAISSADEVLRDPRAAWEVNVEATRRLAKWAIANDRRLVLTSTDLVFDGIKPWSREGDLPRPILEYGRTKRAAEIAAGEGSRNLTVRVSLLYGKAPAGKEGFFDRAVSSMRGGASRAFFDDEFRTPLDYATAAGAVVRLALSSVDGVIHLGGPERLSRFEVMRRAAGALGIDPDLVQPTSLRCQPTVEPRPIDVSLDTSRLRKELPDLTIPPIEKALHALDRWIPPGFMAPPVNRVD